MYVGLILVRYDQLRRNEGGDDGRGEACGYQTMLICLAILVGALVNF